MMSSRLKFLTVTIFKFVQIYKIQHNFLFLGAKETGAEGSGLAEGDATVAGTAA